jgi:hypothetical protein
MNMTVLQSSSLPALAHQRRPSFSFSQSKRLVLFCFESAGVRTCVISYLFTIHYPDEQVDENVIQFCLFIQIELIHRLLVSILMLSERPRDRCEQVSASTNMKFLITLRA